MNAEKTVPFKNFLIIGLCNSSANCWFYLISLLKADLLASVVTPLPAVDLSTSEADFYQKMNKP